MLLALTLHAGCRTGALPGAELLGADALTPRTGTLKRSCSPARQPAFTLFASPDGQQCDRGYSPVLDVIDVYDEAPRTAPRRWSFDVSTDAGRAHSCIGLGNCRDIVHVNLEIEEWLGTDQLSGTYELRLPDRTTEASAFLVVMCMETPTCR